jgi:hypothetical protein
MLNNSAILVTFTGKMWNARKFDKTTTDEITQIKHTTERAGRFNKNLMPDDPILKQVKAQLAAIRHYHYSNTLPWEWKGGQLLPSKHHMEYSKQMAAHIRVFDDTVDQFVDPTYYQQAIEAARIKCGSLFDLSDYPHPSSIREQFYAKVDYAPVPQAGDYRVDLPAQELQSLKEDYQKREGEIIRNATNHLYERLDGLARHARERLADPKKSFHKTLPENIKEFTELLPNLNITKDQFLNEQAAALKQAIGIHDPDTLRKDEQVRKAAADTAGSIVDKIKKQMEAFNDAT